LRIIEHGYIGDTSKRDIGDIGVPKKEQERKIVKVKGDYIDGYKYD